MQLCKLLTVTNHNMYKNKMFYIKCRLWWDVTWYIYLTLCFYSAVVVSFQIKIAFLKNVTSLRKPRDEKENEKKNSADPFSIFLSFYLAVNTLADDLSVFVMLKCTCIYMHLGFPLSLLFPLVASPPSVQQIAAYMSVHL